MPGLGGPDFYRMVTEQKSHLKDRIIFITGDALDESAKAFIDSVTNPHIEKPFNLNKLGEIIVKTLINTP
jgi:CheY-like chemotaxis protein